MFNHSNAFPHVAVLSSPKAPQRAQASRRSPTLSRSELRRLIADMID
jgi:hypothetical protein